MKALKCITLGVITVVYCPMLYICSMPMRYVYRTRESTGKYTEVWQRLSSESPSLIVIVPTLRGIAGS